MGAYRTDSTRIPRAHNKGPRNALRTLTCQAVLVAKGRFTISNARLLGQLYSSAKPAAGLWPFIEDCSRVLRFSSHCWVCYFPCGPTLPYLCRHDFNVRTCGDCRQVCGTVSCSFQDCTWSPAGYRMAHGRTKTDWNSQRNGCHFGSARNCWDEPHWQLASKRLALHQGVHHITWDGSCACSRKPGA